MTGIMATIQTFTWIDIYFFKSYCLGLDLDPNALEICKENFSEGKFTNMDVVQMNVRQQLSLGSSHPWYEKFDTVITNPPFGTKQAKGCN